MDFRRILKHGVKVRSGDIWGHETVACFCKHGNTLNVINFLILMENSIKKIL